MATAEEDLNWEKFKLGDETAFAVSYSNEEAKDAIMNSLSTKIDPEPDKDTPDPATEADKEAKKGGVIRRSNDFRTALGSIALESVGLSSLEISKANRKRANEMYRNLFPLLVPAFQHKCTECGLEHDTEVEECDNCESTDLRDADEKQKREAESFFNRVNKEGQSLQQLYRDLELDHGRLGVATHVIKKIYIFSEESASIRGEKVFEGGEIIDEEVIEFIRADPKKLKPVVDGNGRIGGYWWTCPIHRRDALTHNPSDDCEICGCDLREVFFAETKSYRSQEPQKFYFRDEVITWAFFNPRLNGLDGLSPIDPLWIKQAILEWMDLYAGAFYDNSQESGGGRRYPGKMLIIHTTNADAVEKQLDKMKQKRKDDQYAQGIVYSEFGTESNTAPEAQVIDLMSDEILGQSDNIRKDFKSDIRSQYDLTDVQDSELEDAGGLNAEGLQLEVNDRGIASAHQSMQEGPLKKLMTVMGFSDWEIKFVKPERQEKELNTLEKARAIQLLKESNTEFEVDDSGSVEIVGKGGEPLQQEQSPSGEPPPGANTPGENSDLLGNSNADDEEIQQALEDLEEGQKHIVWQDIPHLGIKHKGDPTAKNHQVDPGTGVGTCDNTGEEFEAETWEDIARECPHCGEPISHVELDNKAREPYFADDEDMPEFVQRAVDEAIGRGAVSPEFDKIDDADKVQDFFEDKLTQPQGWSITSLVNDMSSSFGVSVGYATTVVYDQVNSILNKAREIGYEILGQEEEEKFHWVGPDDDDTTDCCKWIKEQTREPVSLGELREIITTAHDRFFPDHPSREWTPHYSCRHTFTRARS